MATSAQDGQNRMNGALFGMCVWETEGPNAQVSAMPRRKGG